MTECAGEVIVFGIACGVVAVGLAVAALVIVVRGEPRRAATGSTVGSRSRFLRAGWAAASYLLTTSAQRSRPAPAQPSGTATTQRAAGGQASSHSAGRNAGGPGLYSAGGFRVGQRVTPTEAIHTSRGTAWPGTLGVIVHIGGGGQLADSFTIRFPDFTARGVYVHQIHAA
jgi:hypothetical protein